MKNEQFNTYSQDNINSAENQYFTDIKHDKDLAWERIEERLKKNKIIPIWMYYAAASILLLISMGTFFMLKLNDKNNEIADLKTNLKTRQDQNITIPQLEKTEFQLDTVKIVNEKIVTIPVHLKDTLIVRDTITNIIVKKDTIYIKSFQPEKPIENTFTTKEEIANIQSIETNSNNKKKKRNKRFVFQYGKPKVETQNIETKSLITLQTI